MNGRTHLESAGLDVVVAGGPRVPANVGVADDDDVHALLVRTRSAAFCKCRSVCTRVCNRGSMRINDRAIKAHGNKSYAHTHAPVLRRSWQPAAARPNNDGDDWQASLCTSQSIAR